MIGSWEGAGVPIGKLRLARLFVRNHRVGFVRCHFAAAPLQLKARVLRGTVPFINLSLDDDKFNVSE